MNTQFGFPGGAATVLAVAAAASAPDTFDKSPMNPVNMSRTPANATSTTNVPSSKLLDRLHVGAADLAALACVQTGWRYVSEKNNTTVYELNGAVLPSTVSVASTFGSKAGSKASDYYLVKGVTSVRADADSVLSLLATSTTETFALRMNQLFGRRYQNGVQIDHMSCTSPPARSQNEDGSIQTYTEDDAYAVNWLSLKSSGSSDNSRDLTFATYQDAFQRDPRGALVRIGRRAAREPTLASTPSRPEGRLLGVHVLQSFNFKDIPELPRHKYTDRMHLRTSGFVVEETHERGILRLSLFLSLTPVAASLRNPKKYEKWLQTLARSVGNIALQFQKSTPAPESNRIQWKNSDHCALCVKSFHTFRRCHHCRFCGESVCNKCSGFVDSSKVPTLRAAAAKDQYSEVRGCARCIRIFMDDLANNLGGPNVRTSTTGSHSSSHSHSSRLASSFVQPPSPLVVHHYEDDDHSSIDSTSTDGRNYPSRPQHRSASIPMVTNVRQHSDDALTMEDLNNHARANPRFTQPPFGSKSALAMSTPRTQSVSTPAQSPEEEDDEDERYAKALAFAGLPIQSVDVPTHQLEHLDLHGHVSADDVEDASSQFARSMVTLKTANANGSAMEPARATTVSTSSGGSSSFKFSMMSGHLSLHSEPEMEDSFAQYYPPATDHRSQPPPVAPSVAVPSHKLYSISTGSRPYTQQYQPSARPPRPQPSTTTATATATVHTDHARSSSTSSASAATSVSLRANEDMMVPLSSVTNDDTFNTNDMILLKPNARKSPHFVEFSDSHRESILMRPGDGSDMIPLRF